MAIVQSARPKAEDPRFQRSLKALLDAVSELLDREPLQDLSITRIVEAAGVTRPTFYQHFADLPDAARRAGLARLADAFPIPQPAAALAGMAAEEMRGQIERHTLPVLTHLRAHRDFYVRVLEGGGNVAFFEEIVAFVAQRMLPEAFEIAARKGLAARDDLMAVLAGGIMWLAIRWLRGEIDGDAEAMTRRISGIATTMMKSGG